MTTLAQRISDGRGHSVPDESRACVTRRTTATTENDISIVRNAAPDDAAASDHADHQIV